MTFLKAEYIPFVITFMVFWILANFWQIKKFNKWVDEFWAYRRTKRSYLGITIYILGFAMLLFGLLDIRGKEENIKGQKATQKTIIMIDTSTSMLAEDIRPNRLKKAIFLARHFVKKAVGHNLSVVVFSDTQKKLVPFTNDNDLVDARLQSLENLKVKSAGTNLNLALQEAIQYFKLSGEENPVGNIVIFSDAEDNELDIDLNIPSNITVGFVGIGTAQGATIPLRDDSFSLTKVKEYEGKPAITKLDEKNLKNLESKIKNFKYWVATSYGVPTEDLINYFNKTFQSNLSDDNFKIRPVLAQYFVIPSILMIILGVILRYFKNFALLVFILSFSYYRPSFCNEEEKPQLSTKAQNLLEKMKQNRARTEDKLNLADELRKTKLNKHAVQLYKETLKGKEIDEDNKKDFLNYSTTLMESGDIRGGLDIAEKMINYAEKTGDQATKNKIEKNIAKALEVQEQKKQQQNKEDKENNQNNDQKQNNSGGSGESQKDNKQQNDKKDQQNKDNDQQKDDQQKNKDKQNEKEKNEQKNQQNQKEMTPEEKEKMKKKLPAMLKQLMSEDRQLQQKLLDTSTEERRKRKVKDW